MEEEIKKKLFELILWIDATTVELSHFVPEDKYNEYRRQHYDNQRWIQAMDRIYGMTGQTTENLSDGYYHYMFEHYIKPSLEEGVKKCEEGE